MFRIKFETMVLASGIFDGVSSVSNVDVVDDVRSIAVLAVIDGPWYVDDGTVDNASSVDGVSNFVAIVYGVSDVDNVGADHDVDVCSSCMVLLNMMTWANIFLGIKINYFSKVMTAAMVPLCLYDIVKQEVENIFEAFQVNPGPGWGCHFY